jgi:hypothetical protein
MGTTFCPLARMVSDWTPRRCAFSRANGSYRFDENLQHMNPADIANITSRLTGHPYITQEVIWGSGVSLFNHMLPQRSLNSSQEAVQPSMYTEIGDVQEFRYPSLLKQAFLDSGSSISSLQNLEKLGWVPGSGANVFVVNHDLERSGLSLNYTSPSNTYTSAMVFSLAHPYGTPTILSSYSFSDYDQGAPNSGEYSISSSVLISLILVLRGGHLLWCGG